MANTTKTKRINRLRRHRRVRARISGTAALPRVVVFRSNQHINVQVVDDATRTTIVAVSDVALKKGTKTERAAATGKTLAEALKTKKIGAVVFDRGGYQYHGRVKAIADGLREGGIKV